VICIDKYLVEKVTALLKTYKYNLFQLFKNSKYNLFHLLLLIFVWPAGFSRVTPGKTVFPKMYFLESFIGAGIIFRPDDLHMSSLDCGCMTVKRWLFGIQEFLPCCNVLHVRRLLMCRGFGFVTFADAESVTNVLENGPHQLDSKSVSHQVLGV